MKFVTNLNHSLLLRFASCLWLPALLAAAPAAQAQVVATDPDEEVVDEEDETTTDDEVQANVLSMVEIPDDLDEIDIPVPSFIKKNANHIILNGADWGKLRSAILSSTTQPVNIVHIGDSHVQADFSTGTVRQLLQYDFGNAGRGLISPLKLSGTNEPTDYFMQSRNSWIPNKLMSSRWLQTVGFTGASIRPASSSSEITIGTSEADDYNPFSSLTIFHSGKLNVKSVTDAAGNSLQFRSIPSRDYTQIVLPSAQTKVTVNFNSAGDLTVFGASLSGDRPGIFYHAIGNNGAAFETYNRIGNVGVGIAPLKPDLVILSLGTNEAFGRLDTQSLTRSIDRLVSNIRSANPEALIMLTTPMECQKSVTTTKRTRVRLKGRRKGYRTVNRSTRSYSVNRNIAPIRDAILSYGKDKGIAVYDWYEVAGGNGASSTWVNNNLFAKDRVHHSRKGYNLEGRLLYEALIDALSAKN